MLRVVDVNSYFETLMNLTTAHQMLAVNVVMFVQESVSVAFVCLGWMLYQSNNIAIIITRSKDCTHYDNYYKSLIIRNYKSNRFHCSFIHTSTSFFLSEFMSPCPTLEKDLWVRPGISLKGLSFCSSINTCFRSLITDAQWC